MYIGVYIFPRSVVVAVNVPYEVPYIVTKKVKGFEIHFANFWAILAIIIAKIT